ncbi:maltose alpha-D-glucosyltransferase [Aegicerativicinus sediminis]
MQDNSLLNTTDWYKDAIIYELHIKAFFDSNGDGIGDFKGLLQKLDYLEDLGVTAIWLLPFYPSPLRDDGYDIADYYSINPSYGNLKDFKKFISEAHNRGLKVITELVINHTSDQHPWFQKARKAEKGSPERDFYVWSDSAEKYKDARIIFTDTEPSNWSWDSEAKAYYWHRFFSHQPDLNFDNPEVQKEVLNILDFWCEFGVDGFRLDAIPYLFERDGTNCENLPETHVFLKKLRSHMDSKWENKLLLAEANMWPEDSAAYFGDGDECHMNYHFPIMPRMFMSVKMENRYPIIDIIDQTPEIPEGCQWGIFLRNHDELTLEMVTDEERDYMYKVYTRDPKAKINVGIRHRLAPLLENNRGKIELMNVMLFSLPGTPILYYGDEIGMGDNYYLGDRDGVRTPMQWSSERNAGFSTANPHQLYLPTIIDPEYKYESVNVETQLMNSSSLLWWMKRIMAMRKRFKAFGRGEINFLSPKNSKILAFTRTYEEEIILVICNLSRFSQPAELDLSNYKNLIPEEVFSRIKFPKITDKSYLFTLSPFGYYWFQLKSINESNQDTNNKFSTFKIDSLDELLIKKQKQDFEGNLLKYIIDQPWYNLKDRIVQDLKIIKSVNIDTEGNHKILLLELEYNEGLPELYQLPISKRLLSSNQKSIQDFTHIICEVENGGFRGFVQEGSKNVEFRRLLFHRLLNNSEFTNEGLQLNEFQIQFEPQPSQYRVELKNGNSRMPEFEFPDGLHYKFYRKLDVIEHPDSEVMKAFSSFSQKLTPQYLGSISVNLTGANNQVLGILYQGAEHQEDTGYWMIDLVKRYFDSILTEPKKFKVPKLNTDYFQAIDYNDLPQSMKHFLGVINCERAAQLGKLTAELHNNLVKLSDKEAFSTEEFSLHYQRSVFSGLQGLTRSAFQDLDSQFQKLPNYAIEDGNVLLSKKKEVLELLKKVYKYKIPILKFRTHGDLHLSRFIWTGKNFLLQDFEGDNQKSFSDRRIRRNGLRDVASMLRSFHYVTYMTYLEPEYSKHGSEGNLEEWAYAWFHYMSRIYLTNYLNSIKYPDMVSENIDDNNDLLRVFMMEKALLELQHEINYRPELAMIPIKGILDILK